MKNISSTILILILSITCFGQISISDNDQDESLIDNFQSHTDSVQQLTNGSTIYYISDSLFKGIILTLKNGAKIELDLRYKDNLRGYTQLGADFENFVLVKHRGDGSGNPEQLRVVNKITGEDKWFGNYPFYLDKDKEVVIYKTYTKDSSQIVLHDFSTNKTEEYPTPDTKCLFNGCFEVVQFDENSFTLKYDNPEHKTTLLKIKREK